MAVMHFRSPVELPLLRKGTPKPAPPDERAYASFRVTQRFDDRDFYYNDGRLHRATDIGNYGCNQWIVAMADGVAYRVRDNATALGASSDALGVRIDHGRGITTEYWHLNRQDVGNGQPIKAGQRIGIHGSTGLGSVCHCHIEAKRNGERIDPEPLMFGGFLVVPEDDDVQIKGKFIRHVHNRSARLTTDSHFRAGVEAGDDSSLEVLNKGALVYPILVVEGRTAGTAPDRAEWYGCIKTAGVSGEQLGYVHSSVLPRTPDGKGVALEVIERLGDEKALQDARGIIEAQTDLIAEYKTKISAALAALR